MKSRVKPTWRVGLLLALLNAAWMFSMFHWTERETWLWIIPLALSINCLFLAYDRIFQLRHLVGHPLIGQDSWGLRRMVQELSEQLGVRPPRIFLIPRHSAQILAYGKSGRETRLYVTQGLVELLPPRQLRAVLSYQMIGIRKSYGVLNYWIAALLDFAFRAARLGERAVSFALGWAPPLATWFIYPFLWFFHFFLLGTPDFSQLDRETAQVLENPEDLALALWKMEAYAQTRPWPDSWIFAHMCMVSPLSRKTAAPGLRVQPRIQERIQSLIGRYPF